MTDCNNDLLAFYDSEVVLSEDEQTEMRERRDTNRKRLKTGLKAAEKPLPFEFASQGSYRDKTMVQYPDKKYDIDDGAYFDAEDLIGPKGAPMSALSVRQMVRDALADDRFNEPPFADTSCVVISYNEGYKVDMPVYRLMRETNIFGEVVDEFFELGAADWVRSDARDVSPWFDKTNKRLSPDDTRGRQFRRVVRYIKKFAVSRESWRVRILTGFGITILAEECFRAHIDRDDLALQDTLLAMRDRLKNDLRLQCPVPPFGLVTESDDAKAAFFAKQLDAINDKLTDLKFCTDHAGSLKLWSKIFNNTFFEKRRVSKSDNAGDSRQERTSSAASGLLGLAALGAVAYAATASTQSRRSDTEEPSEPVLKGGSRTNA